MNKKLDKLLKNSRRIKIDKHTKLAIMSDCHRGAGDSFDNFTKNQNIFIAALKYYYDNNFTYIELGDGDEMWEVDDYESIIKEHIKTFKLMKKFNDDHRLIMLYGNHDIIKRSDITFRKYFYEYNNDLLRLKKPLLTNLKVEESLVLDYHGYELFLLHGHQIDLLNSTLWKVSRFLVRNVWRRIEKYGLKDPTNAAKNYVVAKKSEKYLKKWSIDNNKIIIAGHTHRPIFPNVGDSLYFNDGSCIHPNGITSLELENGMLTLVKWFYSVDNNNIIVEREVIAGKERILNYFLTKKEDEL